MSIFEYDYNGHMELIKEEAKEEGKAEGKAEGIALVKKILKLHSLGRTIEEIAKECKLPKEEIEEILND